jgi:hypothetical protein
MSKFFREQFKSEKGNEIGKEFADSLISSDDTLETGHEAGRKFAESLMASDDIFGIEAGRKFAESLRSDIV